MYIFDNFNVYNDLEIDYDKDKKIWKLIEICDVFFFMFEINYNRSLLRVYWCFFFKLLLFEILFYYDLFFGNDWINVLIKLVEFCFSLEIRNDFYMNIIKYFINYGNFNFVYRYFEKI